MKNILQRFFLIFFLGLSLFKYTSAQVNTIWADNDPDQGTTFPRKPTMSISGYESTDGVVVDNNGDVYVAGQYQKQIASGGPRYYALYIYKYSADGVLLWEADIYVDGIHVYAAENSIAIGSDGIYVVAETTIGGGGANINYTSANGGIFTEAVAKCKGILAKFTFSGQRQYSRQIRYENTTGVTSTTAYISDITVDQYDQVYIVGYFNAELYSSANTSQKIRSNACTCCGAATNTYDMFVFKHTNSLSFVWSKAFDFKNSAYGYGIAADGDYIYLCGGMYTSGNTLLSINSNYSTYVPPTSCSVASSITSSCYTAGYLSKLDNTGALIWNKKIESPSGSCSTVRLEDVEVRNGVIYVLAESYGNIEVKFGTTPKTITGDNGLVIRVINNTSTDLQAYWAQALDMSNTYVDVSNSSTLHVDNNYNVYAAMYAYSYSGGTLEGYSTPFTSSSNPTLVTNIATGKGSQDIILAKYNISGNMQWATIIGGYSTDNIQGIATDDEGNLFLGGRISSYVDLDPTPAVYGLVASGSDGFVAKYGCFPIDIVAAKDTFCEGEIITLNALNDCNGCSYSYTWTDVMGGTTITTTTPSYSFSGSVGTNQIIIQASESFTGCLVRDTLDIVINSAVNVTASPSSVVVCPGDTVSFTASATPVGASYYWYKTGNSTLLSTGANFSAVNPGSYTVLASVNGCESSFNVNLDNYNPYSPVITPNNPSICGAGGSYMQVLDCPGCSYVWTPPPASTSSSTTNNMIADVPGLYVADIVDPYGCQQSLSVNVGTSPFLVPPIIPTNASGQNIQAICNNQPITLSTTPYGTGAGQCATCQYNWSDGSTGPYTFAYSPGFYNVTVTNVLTGCVGTSTTIQIRTSNFPDPVIMGGPSSICDNVAPNAGVSNAQLQVNNPCTGCSYTWLNNSTNDNSGILGSNLNSIATVSITGDFYVRMVDTFGCMANSSPFAIERDTASQPPITSTTNTICGTNNAILSTISCAGCSYQWYLNNTLISGATGYQYSTTTAGTYKVKVVYANSCARFSPDKVISNSTTFTPQIGPPNPFLCNSEPVALTITSPTSSLPPPYWSYQWYYNGSQLVGETGFIHNARNPGDYYLQVTNGDGCTKVTNIVNVQNSTAGSNPIITAQSPYLCSSLASDSIVLNAITNPCSSCTYNWVLGNNTITGSVFDTLHARVSGGYYVEVSDSNSNCLYRSPIYEVKDTALYAPPISTITNNTCSTSPVILSTPACPSCSFDWQFQSSGSGSFTSIGTFSQNTYSADSSGNYRVIVIDASGCPTPTSNSVPVTRLPFNAQLTGPTVTSICNGSSETIYALPNSASCTNCEYYWYKDGLSLIVPITQDTYNVFQGGDYYAVIKQTYPAFTTTPYTFGCESTSDTLNFIDVSVGVNLESSALAVCGPSGQVTLSVDSCQSCTYRWFFDGDTVAGGLNYVMLSGQTDTFYIVNGTAAKGMYKVRVGLNGCYVYDSIYLPPVPALTYTYDTLPQTDYANICGGTPITLTANCATCNNYQWYESGNVIPGAIGASYLATAGGDYQLIASDSLGCVTPSPLTVVTEVNPPSGFALILDPVGVIPLSYGDFNLDPYLSPTFLHAINNGYTSVPQPAAVSGDIFSPMNAGSGPHLVTYTYTNQNCEFKTSDTIEVLSAMALDVSNFNPVAPPYESCITDNLQFQLTNFTFQPNQILFPTSATTFDTIAVSPAMLTQFAGVWSGPINVTVPNGAVTGKVKLRDSVSLEQFQSPFFLVVHNPSVALGLNGVPQPLCSNADTIPLSGFPSPGVFAAAYSSNPGTNVPSLISGNNFLVENVTNYDSLSGYQFLKLTYTYTPQYTNGAGSCPDVVDSLNVQVNNVELDSIEYTPISQTQANVPLADLTRLIWPINNRNYPGTYTGTYVTGNNLQANTLPFNPPYNQPLSVSDPVIYTFNNGICSNSISKNVEVWRKPRTLDSIPQWICQNADTVFIGRNATSMYVEINGATILLDSNYIFANNFVSYGALPDFIYDENINVMTLTSSNGGLVALNLAAGAERYAFIPSQVTGANTVLDLAFDYDRNMVYNTPTTTNPITQYTIARVSKTVNIETPIAAQISPAILADTIFCQDNSTQQFAGIPNGGQYYINNIALASNLFNANTVVANGWGGGLDTLTYVFQGNACTDTASTKIIIPAQFTVTITAPNGPDYCQRDAPDTISVASSNMGIINQAAGQFFVNTVISGQVFNPAVAPAVLGQNNVIYVASDTFGCTSNDTTIFTVNPMPSLRMDTFNIDYCLNETPFVIDLYEDTIHSPNPFWHLQTHGYGNPTYPNIQVNLTGNGVTPPGLNPAAPYYNPSVAGVGYDTIRYTYTNTLTGCTTTLTRTTYIKPLPNLTLTTDGGQQLDSIYCERDTVPVYATPVGGMFLSLSTTNPGGSNFNTTLIPPLFGANIPGFTPATATEIIGYRYTDPSTGCTDTIRDTILIRNFTTDVTIAGLPNQVCADDTVYVLTINQFGTGGVNGSFGAFWPIDSNMISNSGTNQGDFNPYLSGIYDTGRDVVVIFDYTSNFCPNTVYDTVTLKPLPQLHFLMPGDTLFNSNDPTFHECFSAGTTPMYAFNSYNGVVSVLPQNAGTYTTTSGNGIVYNTTGTGNWDYISLQAQPGLDSIHFTWTHPTTGCTNTQSEPMVIDTVAELGFAGFDPFKYDTVTQRFVYCENDPAHLVIPSPFGGYTYWNYQPIPSILFELRPDTLVVGGVTTIHRLTYEYISARYQNGGVCIDSTIQFIEVRPTPTLTLAASVPDEYCVTNELERIVLSANPSGGIFQDITLGVIAGIVADTLFDPSAQLGTRTIIYFYTDTVSGCSDTLYHEIDVFNMPDVSFKSGGGCEGDTVFFMPDPTGLSNSFPALDSITMAIWNYGDGQADTITQFANPVVVPTQTHIYAGTGVYFPTLTLINRGQCDTSYTRRIVISPKYNVTNWNPYLQDFQLDPGNWFQENGDVSINLPSDSLWEWSEALGARISPNLTPTGDPNFSWITNPMGAYDQGENAWVYSPCFDISTLNRPMVKLDIWRDTRDGVDGVVMQYFEPVTQSWKTLGQRYKGIKWYNPQYVVSNPGNQVGAPIGWSGVSGDWEDARYRLDVSGGDLRGTDNLRFRLAFSSSPNSVVGGREGFAFDNFWIGNRTRSVLLEHFTNQSYPNINNIETNLYNTVYSTLYGRDVSLIQYHTGYNNYDYLHQESFAASQSRILYYGINNSNQVRVNGQSLASSTDSLINYAREILDMQMLEDGKFRIKLNPVIISNGTINVSAAVIATKDLDYQDYLFHIVVTEDTIQSTQNHRMLSVARKMIPDPAGTVLPNIWVAGDSIPVAGSWQFSGSTVSYNPNRLKVVVFVQNQNTKEVYQVATSRNLNIFNGPVAIDDIEPEEGLEIVDLNLYPNPTRDQFTIEFASELLAEYEWRVVDVLGRTLQRGVAQPGTKAFTVQTDNFSPGMYIFSINNETVYTQRKVIIAK